MGLTIDSEDQNTTLFDYSYSSFDLLRRNMATICTDTDLAKNPFFNHSDCDGYWGVLDCKKVLALIKSCYPAYIKKYGGKPPKPTVIAGISFRSKGNAELLNDMMDGLEYCIKHKQKAVFH